MWNSYDLEPTFCPGNWGAYISEIIAREFLVFREKEIANTFLILASHLFKKLQCMSDELQAANEL